MIRILAMSLTVLLTAQAAPAFAAVKSITITGSLSNGNKVSAVCAVGANGQITGNGVLSGVNPSNGYAWRYYFTISRASTASGKLVLTGNFVQAAYPVTLTVSVPNGPLSFSYVVNGNTYTQTGTGSVTVK